MEGPFYLSSTLSSKNFLQPKDDLPSQRFLSVVSFQCSLLPPASARPQSHPHSQNFIAFLEGREQPHPQGTRRLGSLSSVHFFCGLGDRERVLPLSPSSCSCETRVPAPPSLAVAGSVCPLHISCA